MARSRNIKPGFFLNEPLARCEPFARILFSGLWCIADREGRLADAPRRIKAELLPYDDCDPDNLLQQLHDNGMILRYEKGGAKYIQIINFAKHQDPHYKEKQSVIPPPDSNLTVSLLNDSSIIDQSLPDKTQSRPVLDPLIPDSLNLIPDSGFPSSPSSEKNPSLSAANGNAVEYIPLNTGQDWGVSKQFLFELERAYPAVDVPATLKEIRSWCIANPKKRKTRSGVARFINGWLSKEQNRG